jgi:hypothetical protein
MNVRLIRKRLLTYFIICQDAIVYKYFFERSDEPVTRHVIDFVR